MQKASSPAASMPAPTASLLSAYSCLSIASGATFARAASGGMRHLPGERGVPSFLVRGKFSHRLRDLVWVGHEELLLRGVERHRWHVRCGDPDHRPVEVVE